MKYVYMALMVCFTLHQAFAQSPPYQLILMNDSLVSSTAYEFDIYVQQTGPTTLELASLQLIQTFDTTISEGTLSYTMNPGTSELNASEQPSNGKLSIVDNELRIAPTPPPGAGSGTVVPTAPGLRVGRFRITSSVPFANRSADIAWKNSDTNPVTKVNAYVGALDTLITDSTGHLNSLMNGSLSPLAIASTSPRPSGTAGISYMDSLIATGGTLPHSWSLSGGSLPTGFTLASSGLISGMATLAGTYNFTAQVADSLGTIVTKDFSLTVNPAAASQLAFIQQPTDTVSETNISPPVTVQLKDASGNNVTTFAVSVMMALSSGTGALSGTTTRTTDTTGLATFNDLKIDLAGSKNLTASSTGLTGAVSNSFTISAGAGTQLAFVQQPTNDIAGTVITPAITVQLKDAAGNIVSSLGVAVTMTLLSGTGTLSGTTTRSTDVNGLAAFPDLSISATGSKDLIASSTGLTSAMSSSFTISAAAASQLLFVQPPTDAVAGALLSPEVTVQVKDALGNNVPISGTTISMSISSGTGTLSGTVTQPTDNSGVATFGDLRINSAGSKHITVASGSLTSAVSSAFTVIPTTLNNFLVETSGGGNIPTQTAGSAFTIQVTARDTFSNIVTGFTGTVNITSTATLSAGDGTTAAFTGGVLSTHSVTITNTGTFTITATNSAGPQSGASNSFAVNSATPSQLVFVQQPTNDTAGTIITPAITVQLRDTFGNNMSTSGVAIFASLYSGTGTLSGTTTRATNASGLATFNGIGIDLTGAKILTATSAGLTSAVSSSFMISPAAASQLLFVQQPTNASASSPISPSPTVQMRDAFGNNVPTAGTSVVMSLPTGTGTLSGTLTRVTDAAGLATFNDMSINLSGSKNLTAASTGLTSVTSSAFTISAGAATQLVFVQQPTNDMEGTIFTPPLTIQLLDASGNPVASAGVPISITLTTGSGTLSGTASQNSDAAGLATFNDLSINLVGPKNLTASGTGLTSAVSPAFTIEPGMLNDFLIEASGGGNIPSQTTGAAFAIRITARDGNTNTVTGFAGTVDITSTGSLSSGNGTTPAFIGGVLSSRSVAIANGGNFTITATKTGGGSSGTSNVFTVNNPVPTTTGISPTTKTAGDPTFTITVNGTNFAAASVVRFNGSDRVTNFVGSTQVTATIPAGDLTIAGTYNITVSNPLPGGGASNPQTFVVNNPVAKLKVFLEGAYSSGIMTTALRNDGFLPFAQPYNTAPWSYPGTESVGSIPAGVVDWILIELRTGASSPTRVTRRAAFVKTDGTVVDMNGVSPVAFPGVLTGNYHVVIRHRNHLAVMSANAIRLNDNSSLYDFTTGLSKYFGGDSKNLGGGRFGMYGGDYSADNFIDADDFAGPDNDIFRNGYRQSDLNMDGFIDAADFIFPDNNIFKGTNVPN